MADIFISYSRKDTEFGRGLHTKLTEERRDVWMDWEDIPATVEWWNKIRDGILASDSFVFIISPNSIASSVCNLEIAYARELNKRILPILCEDVDEKLAFVELVTQPLHDLQRALLQDRDLLAVARDNWNVLARLNWINFTDDAEFIGKSQELLDAIDTDIEYVDDHTRLLVRATDWEKRTRSPSLLLRHDDLMAAETWLATADRDHQSPAPTGLHREYIRESRERELAEERRTRNLRRTTLLLAAVGLVAAIITFVALVRVSGAETQISRANAQVATAQTFAARIGRTSTPILETSSGSRILS